MPQKLNVDHGAIKALVAVYGPREAARRAGLKECTVTQWCRRYKWTKAYVRPAMVTAADGKDAGDLLRETLEKSKEQSTLHLARFTERASKAAANHPHPLEVARKTRDVAGVYSTLWPAEEHTELLEGGEILMGSVKVEDDIKEIEAHVREEIPDAGQADD